MKLARFIVALVLLLVTTRAHAAEADQAASATKEHPVLVRAYGGAVRGSLFSLPVAGPVGGVGLGGGIRWSWGGIDGVGDISYDALSTEHGVGVHRLAFGITGELLVWRFRVGAGVDAGRTWIARLSGSRLGANTLFGGVHATAGFDLFTISRVTPYVAARVDYNSALPTLGGNAGVRYAF